MAKKENESKQTSKKQNQATDIKFTTKEKGVVITEKDDEGNVLNEKELTYQDMAAEGVSMVRAQRNSVPLTIDMRKLKKIAKKHKVTSHGSVEKVLRDENFLNDIAKYCDEADEEMQQKEERRKQVPAEVSVVSKILDYDERCNELIDRCDGVLKKLVEVNDACSQKIEDAKLIVEQFNSQREAAQCSETGLVFEKFKKIVDAYQKQAEKAVADARDSLVAIKNLDSVDITAIRKEVNGIIRAAEKDAKSNPDFKQVVEKATKLNDIIKIQRKQVEFCAQKNESKLKGIKITLNDYKANYAMVLDGLKVK